MWFFKAWQSGAFITRYKDVPERKRQRAVFFSPPCGLLAEIIQMILARHTARLGL